MLTKARVSHAAVDLDGLTAMYPKQGRYGERIMLANLDAIWPLYASSGARRLMVARVVENVKDVSRLCEAVPGAKPIVCRLTAPAATMKKRIKVRELGMFQSKALARSVELAGILERVHVEDFTVDNSGRRSITEVARDMLTKAGWLR